MPKGVKRPGHTSYASNPYPPITTPAAAPTSQAASQAQSQAVSPIVNTERPSAPWATEDDKKLMEARAQGLNWKPIAELHFPQKSPNACRKRHERLMEKRNADSWDGVKTEDLAKAYLECREEMWKILATKVNEKWPVVEAKCMEKGLKTLQTTGRRSLKLHPPSPRGHDSDDDAFNDSGLGKDGEHQGGNDGGGPEQPPTSGGTSYSSTGPPPTGSSIASTGYNYSPSCVSATMSGGYHYSPPPLVGMQTHQKPPDYQTKFEIPSIESILQRPLYMT